MTSTFVGMPKFPVAAKAAMEDTQLRRNLAHATSTIRDKRARVVAEVDNWEELRLAGARPRRTSLGGPPSLTPAERRVARMAVAGASNAEIAQRLFVSLRTVETHLTHAYRKLDISSRDELAGVLAHEG